MASVHIAALYAAIAFFIISSPVVYRVVQSLLGSIAPIASPTGCPTLFGMLVHTVVFYAVAVLLLHL